ncbi:MAG: triose-phosphate isomerase [Candidatus Omnitrophota bacterium]
MRKIIIAGNWKMYQTIREAIELANGLKRNLLDIDSVDIVVCPPFTALSEVSEVILESPIKLGAQDMYWQDEGAFTGEVSGKLLLDAGCSFVILGHSERRQFFSETNVTVNKKLQAALKLGLNPIVCIGENLSQREAGKTFEVIREQLEGSLADLTCEEAQKTILAYEPVWAIGTGKTATPAQAQEAHHFIRGHLNKLFDRETADKLRIQYGGSVKPENIAELIAQPDIDGALVGGASLDVESFSTIVKRSVALVR